MRTICPDCGEECQVIVVDQGIGHYEYWGAKCYDSRPEVVSDCCEAFIEGIEISDLTEELPR